jgi:hypothetical protein
MFVPRPLQVKSSAPAGRLALERASERLLEVCVRWGRVAGEEAQGLADAHRLAEHERARGLVGAEETAHQEVADVVLGPVLVDHQPDQEPARGERLLLGGEGGDLGAQALERRLAGELVDAVALTAGDHRIVSDRPAALRDDSEDGRPRHDGADGALAVHCVVHDQRLRAWPASAGGDPAYERDPFVRLVQVRQERPGREREGIDEQRDEPGVVELGKARHCDPILRLHGRGVEAVDLRSRKRTRPDGHRGTLLELADTGDHSLGDAAEQMPRRELLTDGLGGRLHLVQMRRREEQEREVDRDPAAPAAARRTRRLRRALPGRLRGRQTGPDPARKRLGLHPATSLRRGGCLARHGRPCTL